MTVYVDNFRAPATVGRIRGRWSHLTADTPDELHGFAARLGQKREWFQAACKHTACPKVDGACVHFHYDVVDRVRTAGVAPFAKQLGSGWAKDTYVGGAPLSRTDKKGGDWERWPAALRVREFPRVAEAVSA